VKSMFTAPAARGLGVADAILTRLILTSAAEGRPLVRLETGVGLDAAHRLYRRHGFVPCGPFGDYEAVPASLFFERPVTPLA
ncbi:MAG: GNAT family N-acetyltransferase, partial [Jannaschia sp.]